MLNSIIVGGLPIIGRASSPVLMIPTCFSGVQQCFEPMGTLEEVDEDAEE